MSPAVAALVCHRALPDGSTGLRERIAERFGRFHALVARLLRDARSRGHVHADLDLNSATTLCVAIVQACLLRQQTRGDAASTSDVERLVATLIEGFASPSER